MKKEQKELKSIFTYRNENNFYLKKKHLCKLGMKLKKKYLERFEELPQKREEKQGMAVYKVFVYPTDFLDEHRKIIEGFKEFYKEYIEEEKQEIAERKRLKKEENIAREKEKQRLAKLRKVQKQEEKKAKQEKQTINKKEKKEVKEVKKEIKKFDFNAIMNAPSGGRKRKRMAVKTSSDLVKIGREKK